MSDEHSRSLERRAREGDPAACRDLLGEFARDGRLKTFAMLLRHEPRQACELLRAELSDKELDRLVFALTNTDDDLVTQVRRRPAIYVMDTYRYGQFNCLAAILSRAIDAERKSEIRLQLGPGRRVTVTASSFEFDLHQEIDSTTGFPSLRDFVSVKNWSWRWGDSPVVGFGLPLLYVCAVSQMLVIRGDSPHGFVCQRFVRGRPVEPLTRAAPRGEPLTITWEPDEEIFLPRHGGVDLDHLRTWLRWLAFLLPESSIELTTPTGSEQFVAPAGLEAWACQAGNLAVGARREVGTIRVAFALGYGTGSPAVESFANFGKTMGGGSHVQAFLSTLRGALRASVGKGCDALAGLRAAIAIEHEGAALEGAMLEQLVGEEIAPAVRDVVRPVLDEWLADEDTRERVRAFVQT